MAVVPINKEFVEIRSKEESTPRTTPRTLNEEGQKEQQKKAFESIQDNDKITRTQLSESLKVSMYAVKKAIAALERNNYISFEGNSKHGRWVILKQLKSEKKQKLCKPLPNQQGFFIGKKVPSLFAFLSERTVSIAAFCRICYKLSKPFQYLLQQMLL